MVIAILRIKLTSFKQISLFLTRHVFVNSTYQILKYMREKCNILQNLKQIFKCQAHLHLG